ncbi:MAG TPA: hypothetical protein VNZ49_06545 [Bacteroidia bacterium]|jgi:hypothetical protein|nr:hypothetical protein [Bacteroidia bacterium]
MIKNMHYAFMAFFLYFSVYSQDTCYYKLTTIHGSCSKFNMVSALNPQVSGFSPSCFISIKSMRTDSHYIQEKKIHFVVMLGSSISLFQMKDPAFLSGLYDKKNFNVLSKRIFGGFGINGRFAAGRRIFIDVDLAPCLEIIRDNSSETRLDSVKGSKFYDDFYRGIQLFANIKCEYKLNTYWGCFLNFAASMELVKKFGESFPTYKNPFKTQLLTGIGLVYYYEYKRKKEVF